MILAMRLLQKKIVRINGCLGLTTTFLIVKVVAAFEPSRILCNCRLD